VIVARLNDLLGERVESLYDLPALYNEIAAAAKVRIREDFRRYGLELAEFYVNSITPPDPVQRMIDERSGMQAVGNLDNFIRFEAARAIGGHGGGNGGSTAGAAVEAGVGAGLGLGLVPSLLNSPGALRAATVAGGGTIPPGGAPAGATTTSGVTPGGTAAAVCTACHGVIPSDARFCPACGRALAAPRACADCSATLPDGARFCPACGRPVEIADIGPTPNAPPEGDSPDGRAGDAHRA
jgi:membrane protease subunit (stomatin/prohibitin family)